MMPGRMNPRQMNQMMKRLGISVKEIENVKKVIIQTDTKEYIFDDAEVTLMDAQGQKTYQITGKARVVEKKEGIPKLWCWSLKRYGAEGFYKKMEFEESCLLKRQGFGEDCYFFGKAIDSD